MAIENRCPNGHRVKVEDRLAGRTGRCPICGAAFEVAAVPELPLAKIVRLDPAVVATLPRARPLTADAAVASVPLHPVIAERPELTWCIAYPGGEPTEPIDAATMQAWLDGGHANGTEVVWRSDWAEWRPVQDVFPGFFGGEFRF